LPSQAFAIHLEQLLLDAEELDDAHARLKTGRRGRQYGLMALNRATVVICVSAWESYVEELVRESMATMRPAAGPLGPWPAHRASVLGHLGRFNNPNAENVRVLLSDAIGLADVHRSWRWSRTEPAQAVRRLAEVMKLRHEIAHGVSPRPVVYNQYSTELPDFFRRLARATDRAVRDHLVGTLGLQNPWTA